MKFKWNVALMVMLAGGAFMAGVWAIHCMIWGSTGDVVIAAITFFGLLAVIAGMLAGIIDEDYVGGFDDDEIY